MPITIKIKNYTNPEKSLQFEAEYTDSILEIKGMDLRKIGIYGVIDIEVIGLPSKH